MLHSRQAPRATPVSVMLVLALTACGGGGGGGGGGATPTPIDDPPLVIPRATYVPDATLPEPSSAAAYRLELDRLASRTEYDNNPELRSIGGREAHARRYRGEGAVVAVTDCPVYRHPDLRGQVACAGIPGNNCFPGLPFQNDATSAHGTIVSLVIAGRRDTEERPLNYVGVAPAATILAHGVRLSSSSAPYNPITLRTFGLRFEERTASSSLFNQEVITAADIFNASFGWNGSIDGYSEELIRYNFPALLETLEQDGVQDKTIFVFAAGNAQLRFDRTLSSVDPRHSASSPEIYPGLSARIPELRGHVLAVVATEPVSTGGQPPIAAYSNRCGLARDFCLAAPGNVRLHFAGTTRQENYRGTSFAAPQVSGALAVLASMVTNERGQRSMLMTELVQRLLRTTDKSGIYGDAAVYGQGMLDLEAATRPVGGTRITLGTDLTGAASLAEQSMLLPGPAFGDAFHRALAAHSLTVFDELDFPFPSAFPVREPVPGDEHLLHWPGAVVPPWPSGTTTVLGGRVEADRHFGLEGLRRTQGFDPAQKQDLEAGSRRLQHLAATRHSVGIAHSWALGRQDELHLGFFQGQRQRGTARTGQFQPGKSRGLLAEFIRRRADSTLAVGTGIIEQDRRFLGLNGSGAWRTGDAHTVFASVFGLHPLRKHAGWQWLHSVALGVTTVRPPGASLFTAFSPLLSSEAMLGIEKRFTWREGDRLNLQIRQPLRVEKGTAELRYAAGRRIDGSLELHSLRADLHPSGRTLEAELSYLFPLNTDWELRFSVGAARQPGHRRQASPEGFGQFLLQLRL